MTQGAPICKACVTGFLHDGTPKGTVETIANLQTYVSKPTSSKQNPGIIVIIPDIFGWTFNNNRLLADEYAEKAGRIVYLPDFMFGTSLSAMLKMAGDVPQSSVMDVLDPIDDSKPSIFQKIGAYATIISVMMPWLWRHRQAITIPMVRNFFQTLRTENPDTKIGVAGFCWGGRYALLLGQKSFAEKPLVDAVFAGHPSMMALPADVEGLVVPASIAAGTMDYMFSPKMVTRTKEVWKDVDVETEIITYEAKHGFCVRGNMNNEKEKKVMDEAIEQAVNWFDKFLS